MRGNFESLVEQHVFDDVQAVLAGKRPRLRPNQKCHPDFPLRGFVVCHSCGKPLTGCFAVGRAKRRYGYYHCQNKACKGVSVRKEVLERTFLAYLETLQPKPGYMRLFREVVLDVWQQRQQEGVLASVSLGQKVKKLKERVERLTEAFIYERAIDRTIYENQKLKLEEELMLAEMESREAEAEECDVEGVLTFAEHVIVNAARLWTEFSVEQKQRFQRVLFPEGLRFDGRKYQTAVMCPVFGAIPHSEGEKSRLATLPGIEPGLPP